MAVKFDLKSFFVNHCEKVVGAIIAVLALWGFAQASCQHTKERPEGLIANADRVEDQINSRTEWPEDEHKKFVISRSISKLAG